MPASAQRLAHALLLAKKFMRIFATGIRNTGGVNADVRPA
jgi:hypothetical protein